MATIKDRLQNKDDRLWNKEQRAEIIENRIWNRLDGAIIIVVKEYGGEYG